MFQVLLSPVTFPSFERQWEVRNLEKETEIGKNEIEVDPCIAVACDFFSVIFGDIARYKI